MNFLYTPEDAKNIWGYNSDVGIIGKGGEGTDYDAEQDQEIESNKQQIQEVKHDVQVNDARDDAQQRQLDANDALDRQQQEEIDANRLSIEANESRDDAQQSQIDETIERLNANIADDERQQMQIDANTESITQLSGEMPTLEMQGTTLVVGKKGDAWSNNIRRERLTAFWGGRSLFFFFIHFNNFLNFNNI